MEQRKKFVIKKATISNVKEIHELISKYSKQGLMLYRPSIEIESKIRDYFVCDIKGRVIGCVALRIWNKRSSEIYALAVGIKHTGKGIGAKLIRSCIADAKKLDIPSVFALTSKPSLFKKLGFKKLNINELPKVIFTEKIINIEKAYGLKAHKIGQRGK